MIVSVIPKETVCSALRNTVADFNNGFKSGAAVSTCDVKENVAVHKTLKSLNKW